MFYFLFVYLNQAFAGKIDKNVDAVVFSDVLAVMNNCLLEIYDHVIDLESHSFTVKHRLNNFTPIDSLIQVIDFGSIILIEEK